MIDQLRPDYVKRDPALISHVETAPQQQRSVRELLDQSRSLGIDVIAEGIERPEERDWLASAGIRLMQGYLFGRPFPTQVGSEQQGARGQQRVEAEVTGRLTA